MKETTKGEGGEPSLVQTGERTEETRNVYAPGAHADAEETTRILKSAREKCERIRDEREAGSEGQWNWTLERGEARRFTY